MAELDKQRERMSGDPQGHTVVRRAAAVRVSRMGPALQPDGQVPSHAYYHACLSAAELHIQRHLLDAQHHDRRDQASARHLQRHIRRQVRVGRAL